MSPKIVSLEALPALSKLLKTQGKRLVTTNGCFDLLHFGHIQYLNEARALGDVLLVGLNSDASVRALKGPARPLNREDVRAKQLAALECVDYVAIFSERTPDQFLRLARPAIHVKGGDYRPEDLPERATVEEAGGRVQCLSLVPGYSTTGLIEKLKFLADEETGSHG